MLGAITTSQQQSLHRSNHPVSDWKSSGSFSKRDEKVVPPELGPPRWDPLECVSLGVSLVQVREGCCQFSAYNVIYKLFSVTLTPIPTCMIASVDCVRK